MKSQIKLLGILLIGILILISACQKTIETNYQPKIDSLNSAVSNLQHRSDSLAAALAATNANIAGLSKRIDSLNIQITIVLVQITQLNVQITQANANITSINAQIVLLNQQLAALTAELNSILAQLSVTPTSLTSGLVAYYPFSGNTNDSSGNGNNGTLHGGVSLASDRFGNSNNAYLFDGQTGFIDIPSLNSLQYKPITYSTWIWVNGLLPTNQGFRFKSIIGRNTDYLLNTGELGLYAGYGTFDNTFLMWRGGGVNGTAGISSISPTSILTPTLNTWIHILYTQNANGDWQWFINGKLSHSGNFSETQDYYNFFRIGGDNIITHGNTFWDGKIDDIRIYNRVLTAQEITYLASH